MKTTTTIAKSTASVLVKTPSGAVPAKKTAGGALAHNAAPQGLKLKQVLLVDTGDGAFTDASIKVKPFKGDATLMAMKCTDLGRLMTALAGAGIKPVKLIKGSKHHIAVVRKSDLGNALAGGHGPAAFPQGSVSTKAINGSSSKLLK